ncbi:MAG: hypothetical protein AABX36_00895, partial [Candidatus Thermoplasmatota archaeon]
ASQRDSWAEIPPGSGYCFRYSWTRSPFAIAAQGLEITARTRVGYQVRAAMRQARPWPFKGGFVHRLLVDPRKARAGLRVHPILKPRSERVGAITDIVGFGP